MTKDIDIMTNKRERRMRLALLIMGIVALLIIVLLNAISISFLDRTIKDETTALAVDVAEDTAADVELLMESLVTQMTGICEVLEGERNIWDEDLQHILDSFISNAGLHNMKFIDQSYTKYDRLGEEDGNIVEEEKPYVEEVRRVLNGESVYEIFYNIDGDSGEIKVRFILPVYGSNAHDSNNIIGVMCFSMMHEEYEKKLFPSTVNSEDVAITIIDHEGNTILSNEKSTELLGDENYGSAIKKLNSKNAEIIDAEAINGYGPSGNTTLFNSNGTRMISAWQELAIDKDWLVMINADANSLRGKTIEVLINEKTEIFIIETLAAIALLIALILFARELRLGRRRANEEIYLLQESLKDTKYKLLNSQMQPHFLYNALASIREIVLEDPEYASDLIYDFSTFLRATIKRMTNEDMISFETEVDSIMHYSNIEKMRFGDRLKIEFDIRCDDFEVFPLSIQPLVENAIRHGIFERGKQGGTVKLSSVETDNAYVITVSDDGMGFDVEATLIEIRSGKRDSAGLSNLIYRLENVMDAKVDIKSTKGVGTVVTISIPKKSGGYRLIK